MVRCWKPAALNWWVRCHAGLMLKDCGRSVVRNLARGSSALTLWYACRAMDPKGRGWAFINERGLAVLLGVSAETIKRWRRQCLAFGFLRSAGNRGSGQFFYASLVHVAKIMGVEKLGAIWEESVLRLNRSTVGALATEATIDRRQAHAEFIARLRGADPKQLLTAKRALNYRRKKSSDSYKGTRGGAQGPISGKGNQTVFAGPDAEFCGVTQALLARDLGISDRTIRRHTSNDWRTRDRKTSHGKTVKSKLTRIKKARVLDKWIDRELNYHVRQLGGQAIVHVSTHADGSPDHGCFLVHGPDLYRVRPNLYQKTNDHLFSQKKLRAKVAAASSTPQAETVGVLALPVTI